MRAGPPKQFAVSVGILFSTIIVVMQFTHQWQVGARFYCSLFSKSSVRLSPASGHAVHPNTKRQAGATRRLHRLVCAPAVPCANKGFPLSNSRTVPRAVPQAATAFAATLCFFAGLEAFLNFCAGCLVFSYAIKSVRGGVTSGMLGKGEHMKCLALWCACV